MPRASPLARSERSPMMFFSVLLISASALLRHEKAINSDLATDRRCTEQDHQQRKALGKKLAALALKIDESPMCMQMCKDVGACPVPAGKDVNCNCFACSGFDASSYASANDGVMTWEELLKHMDDLGAKWKIGRAHV